MKVTAVWTSLKPLLRYFWHFIYTALFMTLEIFDRTNNIRAHGQNIEGQSIERLWRRRIKCRRTKCRKSMPEKNGRKKFENETNFLKLLL